MILGIDKLVSSKKSIENFALVSNYASVNSSFEYSWDTLYSKYPQNFKKIFSPQHGLWGTEQANMIESPNLMLGDTGVKIISLYSKTRKPKSVDLEDVKTIIIDLPDVGAKYYTYIYTMALVMEASVENNKKVVVLDRPNPISAGKCYGNINKLKSFVGMYPIPIIHGMTIGELANLFNNEFDTMCDLEVIKMENFNRNLTAFDNDFSWIPMSPNMPYPETAFVYPGGCLLEGTNVSEGRGTTRPFEILGAPFIDSKLLIHELQKEGLQGVFFREFVFKPVFDKFANEVCNGIFVHITDRQQFNAYLTYIVILKKIFKLFQENFKWIPPPYEYEFNELPIDIISGDSKVRDMIEKDLPLKQIKEFCEESINPFLPVRDKYLLY